MNRCASVAPGSRARPPKLAPNNGVKVSKRLLKAHLPGSVWRSGVKRIASIPAVNRPEPDCALNRTARLAGSGRRAAKTSSRAARRLGLFGRICNPPSTKQECFWEDAEISDLDLIVRSLGWDRFHKAAIQAGFLRVLPEILFLGAQHAPNDPPLPSVMTFRRGDTTRFQRGRSVPGHGPAQNKNDAERSRAD